MKTQRLALALAAINLVLLFLLLTRTGPTAAQSVTPTLRARVIELVDERGRVRSRLKVESGGESVFTGANGRRVIRP